MLVPLAWSWIPDGVEPVRFLALGSLAVMLLGAAKSGFGGSIGMLSVPMMVYACGGDAPLATGIMLPVLIACDYASMAFWWRKWDGRNVSMLVPGMVLGIALGWVAMWIILYQTGAGDTGRERSSTLLNLCIGAVALGFVTLQVARAFRGELRPFHPVFWHGLLAGSSAGFVSTLANSAGPITNMYLLPQQMTKGRFVATTVLYYWIGNQVKLVPYYFLGLLNTRSLAADAVLLPAVLAGALLGMFLHNRVNERRFTLIVYVLLGGIGLDLVVRSALRLGG